MAEGDLGALEALAGIEAPGRLQHGVGPLHRPAIACLADQADAGLDQRIADPAPREGLAMEEP
ncbi:hypothetical protein MZTS_14115 [Methylorubrum zatmanii]|nr:hypothetical protein [Methylorubrum zatmanii]MBD8907823.1 hypothetical protein [Methylorubrum zatmanii]